MDLDGDLDLVVGNHDQRRQQLLLNDGRGYFRDVGGLDLPPDLDLTSCLALIDVDLDDDPDLVVGHGSESQAIIDRLYLNTTRQVVLPRLAWLGRDWPIDCYSNPAQPAGPLTVFAMLGVLAKRQSFPPFGILGIDPSGMVALPMLATTRAAKASYPLVLPAVPAVAGRVIYVQALVMGTSPSGPTWRFTNVVADQLLQR